MVAAVARITGRCSGRAPAMTATTAMSPTVYLISSLVSWLKISPDQLVARTAGAGEHELHPFGRGKNDRQPVGPAPLVEQALEVVLGVGREQLLTGGGLFVRERAEGRSQPRRRRGPW